MGLNYTVLQGRLTKDVELRQTQSGTAVCQFSIAVNRDYKDESGDTPADFINCVAWKQTAEFLSRYFKKGQELIVEGGIQTRTYTDNNNTKHYVTEVNVTRARFCGPKQENTTAGTYIPDAYKSQPDMQPVDNDDDLPF